MMPKDDIAQKFEHLFTVIQMPKFLRMEALGGEIPFFISTYQPEQELEIGKAIQGLKNKLERKGIEILELNLYDLVIELLDEQLGKGEIFALEQQMDKEAFKNALQSVLDITQVVMPRIRSIIEATNARVYFLTGVGNVYPFIRSHNILNNLQAIAKAAPTVLFFPGKYNGQSLELFGKLKDDNYYRAFNLDNYRI